MIARIVSYFLIAALAVSPAWSQESRGKQSGRVTDTSAAPIPGALVQVTNVRTGIAVQAQNDASGILTAPPLLLSISKLTAIPLEQSDRENVEPQVGGKVQLNNFIGSLSQTVRVTDLPPEPPHM